jgi:predicted dehydrogenase
MKILILGNSSLFQRKIYYSLKKIKRLKIEIASKRKFVLNKYPISYNSYKQAINKTKAKIVYISLVNSEHFKWAIYCLKKNKHIIIDKPFTINYAQTKKIINLAKRKKLFISEAIVFQHHKRFKKLISLLDFNRFININSKFHIPKLEKNNFRNSKSLGGGCFQDMSSYAAHIIYLIFSNQKYQIKRLDNGNNFNNFSILVKSKNRRMKSSFKFNSNYKNQITIKNNLKTYSINFAFSPPINKDVSLGIFDDFKKKEYKLYFKKQNTFDIYFLEVLKLIKNREYNYFYNEIEKRAKIKKEIS